MQRERLTVSMEAHAAARVRQCGARTKGGASAYLENLVRQDALAEAAESAANWYAAHPGYAADSAAEARRRWARPDEARDLYRYDPVLARRPPG